MQSDSPLPPDYVNIPAARAYDNNMPAAVKETFIQIRGLAWKTKYQETPPYSVAEIAELIGKPENTVYDHVRILELKSWLLSKKAGYSRYTYTFPCPEKQSSLFSDNSDVVNNISGSSLDSQNGKIKTQENRINTTSDNSGNYDGKQRDINLDHPAVILYRGLMRITANSFQREKIVKLITDMDLWRKTLEHWRMHGWNPTNVGGMLSSYEKGGPAGCATCRNGGNSHSAKSLADAFEEA